MTREEELINYIKEYLDSGMWRYEACSLSKKDLEIIIKALEQEPCEDCISRAELLKAIDTWDKFGLDDTNHLFRLDNLSMPHYVPYIRYDDVIKCIKGMPKAEPKTNVLDKIRAEIEGLTYYWCEVHPRTVIDDTLEIIDKYRQEG